MNCKKCKNYTILKEYGYYCIFCKELVYIFTQEEYKKVNKL